MSLITSYLTRSRYRLLSLSQVRLHKLLHVFLIFLGLFSSVAKETVTASGIELWYVVGIATAVYLAASSCMNFILNFCTLFQKVLPELFSQFSMRTLAYPTLALVGLTLLLPIWSFWRSKRRPKGIAGEEDPFVHFPTSYLSNSQLSGSIASPSYNSINVINPGRFSLLSSPSHW